MGTGHHVSGLVQLAYSFKIITLWSGTITSTNDNRTFFFGGGSYLGGAGYLVLTQCLCAFSDAVAVICMPVPKMSD